MMAKPMKTLHLHYPMIQFLIMFIYTMMVNNENSLIALSNDAATNN